MNVKDQIRTDIERIHSEAVMASFGNETSWLRSRVATCVDILAFIDTLPEQPVEGLEEVAGEYASDSTGFIDMTAYNAFKAGAEWGAVHIPDAARSFLDAVQRYVEPKKGDRFISRNELLNAVRNFRACIEDQRTMR